ncbi:hypothetical protein EKO04_009063 [Ascochyta lentis]|uniref:Uncharacterized protein n=1 Tax=Ascochyta lentis TaxID=205686 RepID=A0A8H7MC38_9PLEO|nr:hypothetical protein EKO04_009063 [Ascochyta lentis]
MRFPVLLTTLALSMVSSSFAAPTTDANPTPHNPPTDSVDTASAITCPNSGSSCGVVNFTSGQYVSFGQGVCMQLGANVQSIYVTRCYCTMWNTCTGNSKKDVYVGGMMMCEKPRSLDEFGQEVRYISCGGLN